LGRGVGERSLENIHQYGEKMIMILKTLGSQKGSPAAAEEGAEGRGGGRGGGGERRRVQCRLSSNLCTARGDWALHPEDLSQTTVHPTEYQSRP